MTHARAAFLYPLLSALIIAAPFISYAQESGGANQTCKEWWAVNKDKPQAMVTPPKCQENVSCNGGIGVVSGRCVQDKCKADTACGKPLEGTPNEEVQEGGTPQQGQQGSQSGTTDTKIDSLQRDLANTPLGQEFQNIFDQLEAPDTPTQLTAPASQSALESLARWQSNALNAVSDITGATVNPINTVFGQMQQYLLNPVMSSPPQGWSFSPSPTGGTGSFTSNPVGDQTFSSPWSAGAQNLPGAQPSQANPIGSALVNAADKIGGAWNNFKEYISEITAPPELAAPDLPEAPSSPEGLSADVDQALDSMDLLPTPEEIGQQFAGTDPEGRQGQGYIDDVRNRISSGQMVDDAERAAAVALAEQVQRDAQEVYDNRGVISRIQETVGLRPQEAQYLAAANDQLNQLRNPPADPIDFNKEAVALGPEDSSASPLPRTVEELRSALESGADYEQIRTRELAAVQRVNNELNEVLNNPEATFEELQSAASYAKVNAEVAEMLRDARYDNIRLGRVVETLDSTGLCPALCTNEQIAVNTAERLATNLETTSRFAFENKTPVQETVMEVTLTPDVPQPIQQDQPVQPIEGNRQIPDVPQVGEPYSPTPPQKETPIADAGSQTQPPGSTPPAGGQQGSPAGGSSGQGESRAVPGEGTNPQTTRNPITALADLWRSLTNTGAQAADPTRPGVEDPQKPIEVAALPTEENPFLDVGKSLTESIPEQEPPPGTTVVEPEDAQSAPPAEACEGIVCAGRQTLSDAWKGMFGPEPESQPREIPIDSNGFIDPVEFYNAAVDKFRNSEVNGVAPTWAKQFDIDGTPESWARFASMLCRRESGGCRIAEVNPNGTLKRFRTTPTGEKSFGPLQFNIGEYGLETWEDVNDPGRVLDALVEVAERGKVVAYFGSVQRPNEVLENVGWFENELKPRIAAASGDTESPEDPQVSSANAEPVVDATDSDESEADQFPDATRALDPQALTKTVENVKEKKDLRKRAFIEYAKGGSTSDKAKENIEAVKGQVADVFGDIESKPTGTYVDKKTAYLKDTIPGVKVEVQTKSGLPTSGRMQTVKALIAHYPWSCDKNGNCNEDDSADRAKELIKGMKEDGKSYHLYITSEKDENGNIKVIQGVPFSRGAVHITNKKARFADRDLKSNNTIGVTCVGGGASRPCSEEQVNAMTRIFAALRSEYGDITARGHAEIQHKAEAKLDEFSKSLLEFIGVNDPTEAEVGSVAGEGAPEAEFLRRLARGELAAGVAFADISQDSPSSNTNDEPLTPFSDFLLTTDIGIPSFSQSPLAFPPSDDPVLVEGLPTAAPNASAPFDVSTSESENPLFTITFGSDESDIVTEEEVDIADSGTEFPQDEEDARPETRIAGSPEGIQTYPNMPEEGSRTETNNTDEPKLVLLPTPVERPEQSAAADEPASEENTDQPRRVVVRLAEQAGNAVSRGITGWVSLVDYFVPDPVRRSTTETPTETNENAPKSPENPAENEESIPPEAPRERVAQIDTPPVEAAQPAAQPPKQSEEPVVEEPEDESESPFQFLPRVSPAVFETPIEAPREGGGIQGDNAAQSTQSEEQKPAVQEEDTETIALRDAGKKLDSAAKDLTETFEEEIMKANAPRANEDNGINTGISAGPQENGRVDVGKIRKSMGKVIDATRKAKAAYDDAQESGKYTEADLADLKKKLDSVEAARDNITSYDGYLDVLSPSNLKSYSGVIRGIAKRGANAVNAFNKTVLTLVRPTPTPPPTENETPVQDAEANRTSEDTGSQNPPPDQSQATQPAQPAAQPGPTETPQLGDPTGSEDSNRDLPQAEPPPSVNRAWDDLLKGVSDWWNSEPPSGVEGGAGEGAAQGTGQGTGLGDAQGAGVGAEEGESATPSGESRTRGLGGAADEGVVDESGSETTEGTEAEGGGSLTRGVGVPAQPTAWDQIRGLPGRFVGNAGKAFSETMRTIGDFFGGSSEGTDTNVNASQNGTPEASPATDAATIQPENINESGIVVSVPPPAAQPDASKDAAKSPDPRSAGEAPPSGESDQKDRTAPDAKDRADTPPASPPRTPAPSDAPPPSTSRGFIGGGVNLLSGLFQGLMQWFGGADEEEEPSQPQQPAQPVSEPPVGAIVGNPSLIDAGTNTTLSWSTVGTDVSSSTCAIITADYAVFARGGQNGSIASPELSESTRFGLVCNVSGAKDKLLNETLIRVRGDDTDPPRIFTDEQIAASQASKSNPIRPTSQSSSGQTGSNGGSSGNPQPEDVRTCDPEQPMDSFIRCLCEAEPNPRGCSVPPGGTR